MDQPLEEALEQIDDITDTVQQQPPPARPMPSGEKSLHEKLYDIYVEECEKQPEVEGLKSNVKLLEKLMKKESLPCLVVNLYPENQACSLMIRDKDGVLLGPFPVSYVGPKLLDYLDAEELPPFLIDILEKSPVNVFHHGCVIAEIRDYRQGSNVDPPGKLGAEPAVFAVSSPAYQSRHVLLRPTMRSLVSDVHSITSDICQWTEEEKLELESQMILATSEPVCLDPSVAVTCTANKLLFNEQKMMTDSMKQCFTGHEWPYLELDEEQHICTSPPDVDTMVACRKRAEIKPGDKYDLKIAEAGKCVDTWKQRPCELVAPAEVDVHKYARGKPSVPRDDSESRAWSTSEVPFDYLFDWEEGRQPWETKSSMTQSFRDPFLSSEIDSPTEGRRDSQLFLPQVTPSGSLLGSITGDKIEPGRAVGVGQGSVQGKAECLGKMMQGSTDSISLGQLSLGKRDISHVVTSPVLDMRAKTPAPLFTQPFTSGQGFSAVSCPSEPVRGRKFPRLAPPSPAQQTFWGVSSVNTLPQPVQPSASLSESSPATQGPSSGTGQNVYNWFSPAQGAPFMMSSSTGAPASTATSSRSFFPPGAQMPSAWPKAPHCSVTVRLPPESVILHPESQAQQQQAWLQSQQLQQLPQSQLYSQPQHQPEPFCVLIPKQQQPPTATVPPQPVPPTYSQGFSIPQWALSAQQASLFNLAEAQRVSQLQAPVMCQVGSPYQSLGQSQSFQYPAAQVEQLQTGGQNVQLGFLPHMVAVPRSATHHSHQGCTSAQCRCTGRGGPPTAPNF